MLTCKHSEKGSSMRCALPSNRSIDTDAQVRPCAARTRLVCAGQVQRQASMRAAFALALLTGMPLANAAALCLAPGEPIQWRADYCMLKLQTDDEIAVSECIEQEGKRRFVNACASNTHFKKRMCELMIQNGTKAGSLDDCIKDRAFKGRTVQNGGVGA